MPYTVFGNKQFGKRQYSFFHTYFKSLYPSLYAEMLNNIQEGDNDTDPKITPYKGTPSVQQPRDEDPYDRARQNKIRLQDRINGKTTINGMVVGSVPKYTAGQQGMSSEVNRIFSGGLVTKKSPLEKQMSWFDNMNEKAHAININKLIESKGKVGGAGMLYDPSTNKYHSVSLSISDLGETTSGIVKKLTGSSTGKRRTVVGNVPDVVLYGDTVYNTLDGNDYIALLDAIEADGENTFNNYIEKVESNVAGTEQPLDIAGVSSTAGQSPPIQTSVSPTTADPSTADEQAQVTEQELRDKREQERQQYRDQFAQEQLANARENPEEKKYDKVQYGEFEYNTGGVVEDTFQGKPELTETGFIGGQTPDQVTDKQSVADNIPIQGDKGDYIINAPAIENDPETFYEMLNKGLAEAGSQGINITDIPSDITQEGVGNILASAGEFKIETPLAEIIGYDQLDMFNNAGKGEVQQRLAASGGFIDGYANGGNVELPVSKPDSVMLDFYNAFKNKFDSPEEAREVAKEHFKKLEPEQALALTAMAEAEVLNTDGLNGVMHVINNRLKSDYRNFGKQNSVYDVIKQQTGGGAFEFAGLDPTALRATLNKIIHPKYKTSKNNYTNALDSAKEILSGKKHDFTQGALFFWNPNIEQVYAKDFVENVNSGFYQVTGKTTVGSNLHEYLRPSDVSYEIPSENPVYPFDRKVRAELIDSEINPSSNQFASAKEENPDFMYKGSFLGNLFNRQARGANLQTQFK